MSDVDDEVAETIGIIDDLEDAGLLTRRQAEAYTLREIDPTPRRAAADYMEISLSVYDDHVAEARKKIRRARDTIDVLDEQDPRVAGPEELDCGHKSREHVEIANGEVVCLECAGVEPETIDDTEADA